MSIASLDTRDSQIKPHKQKLSPVIQQRLIEFRGRLQKRKLLQLLTICMIALLTGFLLQFGLDRFMETPKVVRATLLLSAVLVVGLACWRIGYRWFWNARALTQLARLLRERFPRLSDQVLSVVELANAEGEQRRSPELVAAAMVQVEKRLMAVDLLQALPHGATKICVLVALTNVILVIGICILTPGAAQNALARVIRPWQSIDRFTFARVDAVPQKWMVASGEPFKLRMVLDNASDWRPEHASCWVSGRLFSSDLNRDDGSYEFELPGMIDETHARLAVGDYISRTLIVPLNRPELSELNAEIELPGYLGYPSPIQSDARSGTLYVLPTSRLRIGGRANRTLSEMMLSRSIASQSRQKQTHLAIESGQFRSGSWQVTEAEELQLAWRDEHGLTNADYRQLKVRLMQDKLPQVHCRGLSQTTVWLATDTLKFDVSAEDDFGIAKLGLQWRVLEPDEVKMSSDGRQLDAGEKTKSTQSPSADSGTGHRVIATGSPELKKLSAQATFHCVNEKLKPQALELRVFAEDYRGHDGRMYSLPYVIRFMSASEHADWIAAQLRRWKGKLDGSHDSELQLLDENRDLRQAMASGRTDQNTAKQKLSQQAMGERSNAEKLKRTIEEGRSLLEQALRNEELRSKQVESWANALDRLNQIAQAAMPQVADKLEQASRAAAEDSTSTRQNQSQNTQPDSPQGGSPNLSNPEKSLEKQQSDRSNATDHSNSNPDGGSSIPETLLGPGLKNKDKNQAAPSPPSEKDTTSPSKQLLEQSIEEQMRSIDELRRAKEAFGELLSELENSTFVKRFKAAAEMERQLAGRLNTLVSTGFGRPPNAVNLRDQDGVAQLNVPLQQAADNLERIQRDLEAYQRDNPAAAREEVLSEMKSLDVLTKLKEMPLRLVRNLRGDTLHRLDFWADTLDRWAEELAGPGKSGGSSEEEKPRDRLPPAILLEILRIIYDQIDLRDETRTLTQIVPQTDSAKQDFQERAAAQAVQQMSIQQRTLNSVSDIRAIPAGAEKFKEELQKLNKAVQHMDDASAMLVEGSVTDEIVSAQTAAIEALIESRRSGGGGGGGGSSGGGSLAGGSTNRQPLDLVGPASDKAAKSRPRQTGEGTGKTGRVLPEEYREGLDTFLNKLNLNRGPQ